MYFFWNENANLVLNCDGSDHSDAEVNWHVCALNLEWVLGVGIK